MQTQWAFPLLGAGVSGACQFPPAHTRQCPVSRAGVMSVLPCLPFIGHKQHFSREGLSFLGKERGLKKAPHLIPVGQRLGWGG